MTKHRSIQATQHPLRVSSGLQVIPDSEIFLQGGLRFLPSAEVGLFAPSHLAQRPILVDEKRDVWGRFFGFSTVIGIEIHQIVVTSGVATGWPGGEIKYTQ